MFLKWLKIPHSKNFTAQKLKFLDVTKGICVKPGSALIHAHHRVRSLQVARPAEGHVFSAEKNGHGSNFPRLLNLILMK